LRISKTFKKANNVKAEAQLSDPTDEGSHLSARLHRATGSHPLMCSFGIPKTFREAKNVKAEAQLSPPTDEGSQLSHPTTLSSH
jgi:hypothetical protein